MYEPPHAAIPCQEAGRFPLRPRPPPRAERARTWRVDRIGSAEYPPIAALTGRPNGQVRHGQIADSSKLPDPPVDTYGQNRPFRQSQSTSSSGKHAGHDSVTG